MESRIYAALYTKLKTLYETNSDDIFVSLPKDFHYNIQKSDVQALANMNLANASSLDLLFDFAHLMNRPVRSNFHRDSDGENLWDIYSNILSYAEIADVQKDATAEEEYVKAYDFLFENNDGLLAESPIYKDYKKYRDAYYVAQEQYNNAFVTKSDSLDAAKINLRNAETEWEIKGHKSEVEKREETIKNIGKSDPSILWREMQNGFDKDIDLLTHPQKGSFAPTYIYPSNFMDGDWDKISLHWSEFEIMLKNAPDEMKVGIDKSKKIVRVSLEYRSVRVERPWLNTSVFKSDLWRFPANHMFSQLSYEDVPEAGSFPSYISALVLFRNAKIYYEESEIPCEFNPGKDKASVLAYICKRVHPCPTPNPKANWRTGDYSRLTIAPSAGGTAIVKTGDIRVGSCYLPSNSVIDCYAYPDYKNNKILKSWKVNGKDLCSSNPHLQLTLPANGLTIEPLWTQGQALDESAFELSKYGKCLVAWKGDLPELDMNLYPQLRNVTTIGAEAFKDNRHLKRLVIGQSVTTIEANIILGCNNLSYVEIPDATITIDKNAFAQKDKQELPFFLVSAGNVAYQSAEGQLFEKSALGTFKVLTCQQCGESIFFENESPTSICPCCGKEMDLRAVASKTVVIPNYCSPLRFKEPDLKGLIRKHFKNKFLIRKDFVSAVCGNAKFRAAYVPEWIVSADAHAEYKGMKGTVVETEQKAEDQKQEKKINYEPVSGTCDESIKDLCVTASTFYRKTTSLSTKANFQKELCFGEIPVEMYNIQPTKALENLKTRAEANLSIKILRQIGGTEPQVSESTITYSNIDIKQMIHPIWKSSVEFEGKSYPISVDGTTGIVSASGPKDKKNLLILILAIAAAAGAIAGLISLLL